MRPTLNQKRRPIKRDLTPLITDLVMKDIEELEQDIDKFIGYFRDQIEKIHKIDGGESTNLFRQILYNSLLDALSRTTAYPKKGNRERIVEFVRNFCDWSSCEKVSLPQIVRLLEKVPEPGFSNLRQYAFSELDKWRGKDFVNISQDPDYNEVKKLWPKDIQKPLENIQIDFFQHVNLFYQYRNSLVHELRKPGYGMEFPENKEPYYHPMLDCETKQTTWELVYPTRFYDRLCETAIKKLNEYYMKDRIDPYSCYIFGTYWIDKLNK